MFSCFPGVLPPHRCAQCGLSCLCTLDQEMAEMLSWLLYRFLQSKWRTHMSHSTSGPPVEALADPTSVPAQPGSWVYSVPFPCASRSGFPEQIFPLMRCSLSLPLSLVCSPQTLPAPQPLAVPPCTGPRCSEPHEVEAYQYFDAEKVKQITVRPLEKYLTCCLPQKFGH